MYIRRIYFYPALGKQGELQTLLQERVKRLQAQGKEVSLSRQVVTPDGNVLAVTRIFSDLTDFEKQIRQDETDRVSQTEIAKMNSLIRSPSKQELFEVLVPFQR